MRFWKTFWRCLFWPYVKVRIGLIHYRYWRRNRRWHKVLDSGDQARLKKLFDTDKEFAELVCRATRRKEA